MGLSKEELQFIDTYLENSDIDYIDVRIELTDHIAATIENELEENTNLSFYDVFKNYMIHHKKNLINNYESQRTRLRDRIIIRFFKSFISLEVMFLVILSVLLVNSYDFIGFKEHFLKVNFGILAIVFLFYYIFFYKTRKTSIGGSLLALISICYYIMYYVKTPLSLFVLIPILVFGYTMFKHIEQKINKKKSIIFAVLFGIVVLQSFLWLDHWILQFITDEVTVWYFFFQMIIWYMLFKVLVCYKLELDKKFEVIFK